MPPDLTVTAIAGQPGPHATPQPGPQPRAGVQAPPPKAGPQFPNPSMRLDHGLGMVVIEFRDPGGEVTRSIPSQRQIDAYRSHQIDSLPGTRPADPPAPDETPPTRTDAVEPPKDTA